VLADDHPLDVRDHALGRLLDVLHHRIKSFLVR
jgi:hypothetical protein